MKEERERLEETRVAATDAICQEAQRLNGQNISGIISLKELLRRPHIHYDILHTHGHTPASPVTLLLQKRDLNE